MELVQRSFSYTHFQYTNVNLSGDNVNYVVQSKSTYGFGSYNETTFDYNGITNALYSYFPPNQFSTSNEGILSAYTIVNLASAHTITLGEYILLKPLFGDPNLLGLNVITAVGDA